MIVFTQTDLPEPVAPAMSRCGIFARSAMTGLPSRSLPSAIGSAARALWKSRVSISSRKPTISGVGIRHLDADGAAARNRRDDADRRRAHGEREVVREVRELAHLHARRRLDLELRDDRARRPADELAVDLERAQRVHELDAHRVELALARSLLRAGDVVQQLGAAAARRCRRLGLLGRLDRRGDLVVAAGGGRRGLVSLLLLAATLRRLLDRRVFLRVGIGGRRRLECRERVDRLELLRRGSSESARSPAILLLRAALRRRVRLFLRRRRRPAPRIGAPRADDHAHRIPAQRRPP